MKTVEELTLAQKKLHLKMNNIVEHHWKDKEPVWDGVNDIPAYLSSPLKIMWILKETWEKGDGRGGWNAYSLFDSTDSWGIRTYKAMAYIKYGFENNVYWDNLQHIKKNASLINILKNIAYINISKIPGQTDSPAGHIQECCKIWKDLIEEQISVYDPDVIIYGGTANFLIPPSELTEEKCQKPIFNKYWHPEIKTLIFKYNGRWIISARHPGRYNEVYIDSLIDALHYVKDQIKSQKK